MAVMMMLVYNLVHAQDVIEGGMENKGRYCGYLII
jgi:hypothetical protein